MKLATALSVFALALTSVAAHSAAPATGPYKASIVLTAHDASGSPRVVDDARIAMPIGAEVSIAKDASHTATKAGLAGTLLATEDPKADARLKLSLEYPVPGAAGSRFAVTVRAKRGEPILFRQGNYDIVLTLL